MIDINRPTAQTQTRIEISTAIEHPSEDLPGIDLFMNGRIEFFCSFYSAEGERLSPFGESKAAEHQSTGAVRRSE